MAKLSPNKLNPVVVDLNWFRILFLYESNRKSQNKTGCIVLTAELTIVLGKKQD